MVIKKDEGEKQRRNQPIDDCSQRYILMVYVGATITANTHYVMLRPVRGIVDINR